jgi:glutathione synthase/RimK-type ligase-like ATP-grasp enzyme
VNAVVHLVTCADLPDGDEDAALLDAALGRAGVVGHWMVWDDPAVDWAAAPAVLRSTWDYTPRRAEFLAWAESVPRLANPAAVVGWNSDKVYLRDLAAAGLPIVPTDFVPPGVAGIVLPAGGEYVIKPSVGAGSRGAGRFRPGSESAAHAHLAALHDAGRIVLIQPYLSRVDETGEAALVYLDGVYSHAARKAALLPAGGIYDLDGAGSLYVEEKMAPLEASPAERAVGDAVIAFLADRFGAHQLYARIDLLPSADGPRIVEVEVAEPSLFLGYADGAADRFATAIAEWL